MHKRSHSRNAVTESISSPNKYKTIFVSNSTQPKYKYKSKFKTTHFISHSESTFHYNTLTTII